jgi:hypothetical protein
MSFAVSGMYLFAGTTDGGVWRRPLSDMITGVEDNRTQIPNRFALEQNYPNPFNPTTNISFSLPSNLFVSLKVYDLKGREVATVVSEKNVSGKLHKAMECEKSSERRLFLSAAGRFF